MLTLTPEQILAQTESDAPETVECIANEYLSQYIFTHREGGHQYAYCTNCHREWQTTSRGKQHAIRETGQKGFITYTCPHCGRNVMVKTDGRGRSKLLDEIAVLYYERSTVSPDTVIIARLMHCWLDLRGDYRAARVQMKPRTIYAFIYGEGTIAYRRQVVLKWHTGYGYMYPAVGEAAECTAWQKCNKISLTLPLTYSWIAYSYRLPWAEDVKSLYDAIADTAYARAGVGDYIVCEKSIPNLGMLAKFAKYPTLEYLEKAGLQEAVADFVWERGYTYGALRWAGKTMREVTGLSKREIKDFHASNLKPDCKMLYVYKCLRKASPSIKISDAAVLIEALSTSARDNNTRTEIKSTIDTLVEYGSPATWSKYLSEQRANLNITYGFGAIVYDLMDYLGECKTLKLDLHDTAICRPRDLLQAHANTAMQITHVKNKELDAKCKKVAERLAATFVFTHDGLTLRPAESATELVYEGKMLGHCVGGYADRYAKGGTIICLLRRVDAPTVPWHTVEFTISGRLVQDRGYHNKTDPADQDRLKEFWKAFEAHKKSIGSTQQKKKARKSA